MKWLSKAISDGCAATILVVEADVDRAVPWTKPDDLDFDPADPWAGLGHLRKEGFLAVFADASQRWVPAGLPADSLHALFTSAAGDEPKGFDTGP